jgi:hypothetical protein
MTDERERLREALREPRTTAGQRYVNGTASDMLEAYGPGWSNRQVICDIEDEAAALAHDRPETVTEDGDPRHAALVGALVAAQDDLRLWLTPGDGDGPDAHTIARHLLAALAHDRPSGSDPERETDIDHFMEAIEDRPSGSVGLREAERKAMLQALFRTADSAHWSAREAIAAAWDALSGSSDPEPQGLDVAVDDVRYAGGNGTSDYWRGFNDGIDKLAERLGNQ